MAEPVRSSRHGTCQAVAILKLSQNTPTFRISETATAPTWMTAPLSTCPAPPTRPERNVVTMNPMPTVSTSAKAHSWDRGNPGRCSFLMPQTSHMRVLHGARHAPGAEQQQDERR